MLLSGLRDHDVRIVTVGRDDHGIGLLDPGLLEQLQVHPVADQEAPGPVLTESPEGVFVLVDHRHVPARTVELNRDGRADPSAADHDRFHSAAAYSTRAAQRRLAPGRAASDTVRLKSDEDGLRRAPARISGGVPFLN